MSTMSHEQAAEELAGVALDATSADIAEQVRSHSAACEDCARELAALEETAGALTQLVPVRSMNAGRGAGIRSRLVSRAGVEREKSSRNAPPRESTVVPPATRPRAIVAPPAARGVTREQAPIVVEGITELRPRRSIAPWLAMAAGLAFVASAAQLIRVTQERDSLRSVVDAGQDTNEEETRRLQASLAAKDEIILGLSGPDVRVISLSQWGARGPVAKMFWDRKLGGWTLVTYNMRQPKEGKTFQLWLVTNDQKKIPAGTFDPDADGRALLHATYKLDRNALQAIAITEEPDGGVAVPTGPVVVAGSAE